MKFHRYRVTLRRFAASYRATRRSAAPARHANNRGEGLPVSPVLITLLIGVLLPTAVIWALEARMRPIVTDIALAQAENYLNRVIEETVEQELAHQQANYGDFIRIRRGTAGEITALHTDVTAVNRLRGALVLRLTDALSEVDTATLSIPLGALLQSEFLWAKGPAIQVRSMSVGTVSAEFESRFTSAGINQTLHRILLTVEIPATVFLPGGAETTAVSTTLNVAETVIVGTVPETYLQSEQILPN